jgi:hypothetical protein
MIVKGRYEALTLAIVGVLARPKSPVNNETFLLLLEKTIYNLFDLASST